MERGRRKWSFNKSSSSSSSRNAIKSRSNKRNTESDSKRQVCQSHKNEHPPGIQWLLISPLVFPPFSPSRRRWLHRIAVPSIVGLFPCTKEVNNAVLPTSLLLVCSALLFVRDLGSPVRVTWHASLSLSPSHFLGRPFTRSFFSFSYVFLSFALLIFPFFSHASLGFINKDISLMSSVLFRTVHCIPTIYSVSCAFDLYVYTYMYDIYPHTLFFLLRLYSFTHVIHTHPQRRRCIYVLCPI